MNKLHKLAGYCLFLLEQLKMRHILPSALLFAFLANGAEMHYETEATFSAFRSLHPERYGTVPAGGSSAVKDAVRSIDPEEEEVTFFGALGSIDPARKGTAVASASYSMDSRSDSSSPSPGIVTAVESSAVSGSPYLTDDTVLLGKAVLVLALIKVTIGLCCFCLWRRLSPYALPRHNVPEGPSTTAWGRWCGRNDRPKFSGEGNIEFKGNLYAPVAREDDVAY